MNDTFAPNVDEYEAIKKIANSSNDGPVLMININKYLPNAGYPDGILYKDYIYLGHRDIKHTARYTRTASARFEKVWD